MEEMFANGSSRFFYACGEDVMFSLPVTPETPTCY